MTGIRSFLATACALFLASTFAAPVDAKGDAFAPVYVNLGAVGGSGQSGRVVMREIGPQLMISGTVAHESPYVMEPSHLRKGKCGSNAAILRDLGMVTRGSLGTMPLAGFTIAQLRAMHASISISKSDKALNTIVSCGNV